MILVDVINFVLQGYQERMALTFLICKTLKTESFRGLLQSALTALNNRTTQVSWPFLCLFTKTWYCHSHPPGLLIVRLLSGHLSQFWCAPAGLASINLLCPQNLQKMFQHPREINRLLQHPWDMARKSVLQGARGGRENCRENQQLLCGQPQVTEVDRGKCELRDQPICWRMAG